VCVLIISISSQNALARVPSTNPTIASQKTPSLLARALAKAPGKTGIRRRLLVRYSFVRQSYYNFYPKVLFADLSWDSKHKPYDSEAEERPSEKRHRNAVGGVSQCACRQQACWPQPGLAGPSACCRTGCGNDVNATNRTAIVPVHPGLNGSDMQAQYMQPQAGAQYMQPQAGARYMQPQAGAQYMQPQARAQYMQPQAGVTNTIYMLPPQQSHEREAYFVHDAQPVWRRFVGNVSLVMNKFAFISLNRI